MNDNCVLYERKCSDCGECDKCDLDSTRVCNNCGNCIDNNSEFTSIDVLKFITDQQEDVKHKTIIKTKKE